MNGPGDPNQGGYPPQGAGYPPPQGQPGPGGYPPGYPPKSNNTALLVTLIVLVVAAIAGGAILYFTGAFGGGSKTTTNIATPVAPAPLTPAPTTPTTATPTAPVNSSGGGNVAQLLQAGVAQMRPQLPIRNGPATITDVQAVGTVLTMEMQINQPVPPEGWAQLQGSFQSNICAGQFRNAISQGASAQVSVTDSAGTSQTYTIDRC